jgi:hypothetical protein
MSWEDYKKRRKEETVRRITLEKFNMPEFWIELYNPGVFTSSELSKPTRQVAQALAKGKIESSIVMGAEIVLIKDWNLTHPETGEKLAIPTLKNNTTTVLPIEIQWFIKAEIHSSIEEVIPKKWRETISGLSSGVIGL